jgi:hypothetical protein
MKLGVFSLWTDARQHQLVYGDACPAELAERRASERPLSANAPKASANAAGASANATEAFSNVSTRGRARTDVRLADARRADARIAAALETVIELTPTPPAVAVSAPRSSRSRATGSPRSSRASRTAPPPAVAAAIPESKIGAKRAKKTAPKSKRRATTLDAAP